MAHTILEMIKYSYVHTHPPSPTLFLEIISFSLLRFLLSLTVGWSWRTPGHFSASPRARCTRSSSFALMAKFRAAKASARCRRDRCALVARPTDCGWVVTVNPRPAAAARCLVRASSVEEST